MFKPGEVAVHKDGFKVTVTEVLPAKRGKWPVRTTAGIYDESELFMAHPSVLATIAGTDGQEDKSSWTEALAGAQEAHDLRVQVGLTAKVQKVFAKATFEWNGHWRNGEDIPERFRGTILKNVYLSPVAMTQADMEALLDAPDELDRWVQVPLVDFQITLRACSCCGEGFTIETNGKVVRIAGPPCKHPNGLPPNEWELNVPSGKLVVANDLRPLFPLPEAEDEFDINTNIGCRQTAQAYAAVGLSHAFVGNTCPGVYRCKDGTFKIANPPGDERWDEKLGSYVPIEPAPEFDGEEVADICTDLWWYSICDYEEYQRRRKHFKQKRNFNIKVVDVPPGVYRFRHNDRTPESPEECVYARFERVRPPDPVKDLLSSYEALEVNPHAYVQAQAARWPTLFGKVKYHHGGSKDTPVPWAELTEEERLFAWRRVADHVFCVIGGGVDWHDKGFPAAKVDPSIPDVDPPSFREQCPWYPFSKPYGGLFQKRFTPAFAKFAFRVLESVISFGMNVSDGEHSRDVFGVRERMGLAVERYRQMMKKYPGEADPEYVAWLKQKGRAEAWVAKFDLGPTFTEKHHRHASRQRWVPEDAYAVEFDARKLKEGNFAWHPKNGGCWARKEDAQRYALHQWSDNDRPEGQNCFWASHATNTSVPLYFVARVVKVGEVSHVGKTLVELAFDYGTPWMQDIGVRKALVEAEEKDGIRVLSKEEYERLLPEAVEFFNKSEAAAI